MMLGAFGSCNGLLAGRAYSPELGWLAKRSTSRVSKCCANFQIAMLAQHPRAHHLRRPFVARHKRPTSASAHRDRDTPGKNSVSRATRHDVRHAGRMRDHPAARGIDTSNRIIAARP
jgi:hypothetical protein